MSKNQLKRQIFTQYTQALHRWNVDREFVNIKHHCLHLQRNLAIFHLVIKKKKKAPGAYSFRPLNYGATLWSVVAITYEFKHDARLYPWLYVCMEVL